MSHFIDQPKLLGRYQSQLSGNKRDNTHSDIVAFSFELGNRVLSQRTTAQRKELGQFLTPPVVARYETEVWTADRPTHLIHFNGDRLLSPRPKPNKQK